MADGSRELAWNLFSELRKELVESQRTRTQIIGFKITFVSAAVAVLATGLGNPAKFPVILLTVPAFAAVFFDFLIHGQSFSIYRIGRYCRIHVEPLLRANLDLPTEFKLWQDYLLLDASTKQSYTFLGNVGLTLLACAVGSFEALRGAPTSSSLPVLAILAVLLALDLGAYWRLDRGKRPPH
jgi:hypothetical protein